jgi:cob(I)alamin adenosyltransferase
MADTVKSKKAVQGRVLVITGDGKGKTTSALGTAFRALGHGQKVCVIQFVKGKGSYGERIMAEKLDNLDWFICGKGFLFNKDKLDEDKKVAEEGFAIAREKVLSDTYDLVILDEVTYLPTYNFLDVDRVIDLINDKPERLSVIFTGRGAHDKLIAVADTVSVIEPFKHAFENGVKAQKGIEF